MNFINKLKLAIWNLKVIELIIIFFKQKFLILNTIRKIMIVKMKTKVKMSLKNMKKKKINNIHNNKQKQKIYNDDLI